MIIWQLFFVSRIWFRVLEQKNLKHNSFCICSLIRLVIDILFIEKSTGAAVVSMTTFRFFQSRYEHLITQLHNTSVTFDPFHTLWLQNFWVWGAGDRKEILSWCHWKHIFKFCRMKRNIFPLSNFQDQIIHIKCSQKCLSLLVIWFDLV